MIFFTSSYLLCFVFLSLPCLVLPILSSISSSLRSNISCSFSFSISCSLSSFSLVSFILFFYDSACVLLSTNVSSVCDVMMHQHHQVSVSLYLFFNSPTSISFSVSVCLSKYSVLCATRTNLARRWRRQESGVLSRLHPTSSGESMTMRLVDELCSLMRCVCALV